MSRLSERAESFLPLSPQVFQVLLSLTEGALHGYAIIQDVRTRTNDELTLTASTLYDALARLVDQGLIQETSATRHGAGEDSRRRYYALTPLGREVALSEADRLERFLASARARRLSLKGKR
jgi:DNA-binding PadR family transcriptional regulator